MISFKQKQKMNYFYFGHKFQKKIDYIRVKHFFKARSSEIVLILVDKLNALYT